MAPISDKIPEFKKKVYSFIAKEDGAITKEKLIKAGIAASMVALIAGSASAGHSNVCGASPKAPASGYVNPAHVNSLSLSYEAGMASATHAHCAGANTHSSHGSHSSHSSHTSGCSGIDW